MSQGDDRKPKDAPRWAADEPTAMWDGSSIDVASAPPPAERAPAPAEPVSTPRAGLSWPLTIGIAVAVAIAVYVVVRALRG